MVKSTRKSFPHEFLFKAVWPGTALKFLVEAASASQAQKKAEGRVFRMEGGISCLEVKLICQTK